MSRIWVFHRIWNCFSILDWIVRFCRSFRVESTTTIKIYIVHDVLFINEVQKVVEKNRFRENITTIWYKISFCAQNRMNCKLHRIIRRVLGFIVIVNRFMQNRKNLHFPQNWALISNREEVLVRSLTTRWLRWWLEEASCCCWEWFLKNYFSEKQVAAFIKF